MAASPFPSQTSRVPVSVPEYKEYSLDGKTVKKEAAFSTEPAANDTSEGEYSRGIPVDGKVYDLDGPAANVIIAADQGTIRRGRLNFKEFAAIKVGNVVVRASEILKWHSSYSFRKEGPNRDDWKLLNDAGEKDNKIGVGWLENLTWDLK
jgi:hypothetical protein